MKKCWDSKPENRSVAREIWDCFHEYYFPQGLEERKILELAESKRQENIKSKKFLIDGRNHKNHPESFYTSRPLDRLIEKANSLRLQDDISINNLSISQSF